MSESKDKVKITLDDGLQILVDKDTIGMATRRIEVGDYVTKKDIAGLEDYFKSQN